MVLLAIGAVLLFASGVWLALCVALIVAVTVWELARMTGWRHPEMHHTPFGRNRPEALAALAGVSLFAALMGEGWFWLLLAVPLLAGLPGALARDRLVWLGFGAAILTVGYQLVLMREQSGMLFVLWVVGIVIISDTAGYFAGRMLGGPKLWPAVSPKKTWSGTVAGWSGALIWGAIMGAVMGEPLWLTALLSVPICMAGQAGDIAESWLKRRAGVKDSSDLIPGHGGLMDRFDALCGAILAVAAIGSVWGELGQGAL